MSLSSSELERYSRHLLLPEIGKAGQEKIKAAKVVVIGAGGLGAPAILYLAAAGVGTIGIVEFDNVDKSNLQRQIIYRDEDVGESKAKQAAIHANALNPEIAIRIHELRLTAENAMSILGQYDVVIDGSDNFATRFLVNDTCVMLKKPNVHGAIYRFEGQASVFSYNNGPCYRCLFPEPPDGDAVPNCAEAGVLGVVAGQIACVQTTEALKIILGIGTTLSGKLMMFDALNMSFDTAKVRKNENCAVCGKTPSITTLTDQEFSCKSENNDMDVKVIGAIELNNELKTGRSLVLLDVRTPEEHLLSRLPNAQHIPLAELADRYKELHKDSEIVVYCKGGARSMKAMHILMDKGFQKARNLTGGITAWSHEVDTSIVVL